MTEGKLSCWDLEDLGPGGPGGRGDGRELGSDGGLRGR